MNEPAEMTTGGSGLATVLRRNIEALRDEQNRLRRKASTQERIANAITAFAGSMAFVYLHLVFFGLWIAVNLGWVPGAPRFDESLVVLAMFASVEAIFLSTFVLISQNRMTGEAERRADLDLQINLLAEHEITRLVTLTDAIAEKLGVETHVDDELHELKRDVAPEAVLEALDQTRDA